MTLWTPSQGTKIPPVKWPKGEKFFLKYQNKNARGFRNPLHTYTLTMRRHKEIKETIPLTIAMKRIKY